VRFGPAGAAAQPQQPRASLELRRDVEIESLGRTSVADEMELIEAAQEELERHNKRPNAKTSRQELTTRIIAMGTT
jgi:hypothetical protein